MKNYLIFFTVMFSLISCVPMAWLSGISPIPNTQDKFTKTTENILVLPVWEKLSGMSHGRKGNYYVIDSPLFLTVKELPELQNRISNKINVGLVSVNGGIGSFFSFSGVVIISETGKLVRIFCYTETSGKVPYATMNDSYIHQQWRDDLVLAIKKSSNKVAHPDHAISGLYEMFSIKYQIPWSSNSKQSIIDFLNGIKY